MYDVVTSFLEGILHATKLLFEHSDVGRDCLFLVLGSPLSFLCFLFASSLRIFFSLLTLFSCHLGSWLLGVYLTFRLLVCLYISGYLFLLLFFCSKLLLLVPVLLSLSVFSCPLCSFPFHHAGFLLFLNTDTGK